MKKGIIITLAIVVAFGIAIYFFVFWKSGLYAVMQGVPGDAVFVVETPSFNSIHENLRKNKIWQSLKEYPAFEAYYANLEYADSICTAHPVLKRMLTDRPFAVSCHAVAPSQYEFLYLCDLGKLNVIRAFDGAVATLLKDKSIKIIQKGEIREVSCGGMRLYYAIKGNLLTASLSEALVESAIACCEKEREVTPGKVTGDLMLSIDHARFSKWVDMLFPNTSQAGLSEPGGTEGHLLETTFLSLALEDRALLFNGQTAPDRQRFSLLSALNLMDGAPSKVGEIAGEDVALCISLCFDSFSELEKILLENYKATDLKTYSEYENTLARINKYLGVNVLELFTSWIGNEIAVIKPAVDKERRLDNMVIAIQSRDIVLAQDQLGYLTEQIGRKTPVRFKSMTYNGHSINYIGLKGFFSLFLGTYFNKFDRPYYTFIGDYVVFSNSSATLAGMIKDYSLGNTLSKNKKYNDLIGELGRENCVYGYVNTANIYDYLYQSSKPESREEFAKNKGAFLSFENIAVTLVNSGSAFETRMIVNHNVDAPEEYAVKMLSRELEDLADEIESAYYAPVIPDSIAVSTRGEYAYQTDLFAFSGSLSNGDPDGLWEVKDKAGRRLAQLTYRAGEAEGESRFFYPDGSVQAQVAYRDGKIESYKELFPDGTLKMEMEYRKGVRQGDVRFYYSTGHLRGEGKYRKGQRTGTWKYYRVTGETDRKMKF